MTALDLSCDVQDHQSLLWHEGSLICGLQTLSYDLVPWPRIKPWPLASGAWSLSHWITRELPGWCTFTSMTTTWGTRNQFGKPNTAWKVKIQSAVYESTVNVNSFPLVSFLNSANVSVVYFPFSKVCIYCNTNTTTVHLYLDC